jgi:hypothetical protein
MVDGRAPPPPPISPGWADFSIMIECSLESGHCHSVLNQPSLLRVRVDALPLSLYLLSREKLWGIYAPAERVDTIYPPPPFFLCPYMYSVVATMKDLLIHEGSTNCDTSYHQKTGHHGQSLIISHSFSHNVHSYY